MCHVFHEAKLPNEEKEWKYTFQKKVSKVKDIIFNIFGKQFEDKNT